ncbi:MAG: CDP-alcohol phosphatidyltransferase family protein [Deferribacteres bacterium]|nr:CDP-alcohol phosphatidyltransferase family protein [Deferribacteres bacterium]
MVGNLPNLLTLARILLLPFFAATLIYEEYQYALLLFIAASVTDFLDGLVARIKRQITYFGRILDPVADKFFLITSFVVMSILGLIPKWLTIVVISKDLIVVTGCIILYFVTHNLKIEPSLLGKVSSACQFILLGLVLLARNMDEGTKVPEFLFLAVAVLTGLSGLGYVYNGLKTAGAENTK